MSVTTEQAIEYLKAHNQYEVATKEYSVDDEMPSDKIMTTKNVLDGVLVLNELRLWNWIKIYEPPVDKGFMFDSNNLVELIGKTCKVNHSGASFALTMCYLQQMANDLIT